MAETGPEIRLRGVCKRFGSVNALNQLDVSVPGSKTTVLIGPSGCGKSTALRIILGLTSCDSGDVSVDGRRLTPELTPSVRRRMGYVVQGGGLFPHMTARENVTLMARHLRWKPTRCRERLEYLTSLTHFPADGLDRYPAELSGGQRQRVALMRALMLNPDILLLDEPLGALDPMIRSRLQDDLAGVFSQLDNTVVMVTHDLGEAAVFADLVVLMRAGRVVQQGTLRELFDAPADSFVSEFVSAHRAPDVVLGLRPA